MLDVVLASRNEGKLREIRLILGELLGLRLVDWGAPRPGASPGGPPPGGHSREGPFVDRPEMLETGETFEENARAKAVAAAELTGLVSLADDSGLEVDALGGLPGVRSARFAGSPDERNAKLLRMLGSLPQHERTARFRCVAALAVPGRFRSFVPREWVERTLTSRTSGPGPGAQAGGSLGEPTVSGQLAGEGLGPMGSKSRGEAGPGSPDVYFFHGSCEGLIAFEPRGSGGFGYDPVFQVPGYGKTMAELPGEVKNKLSHRAEAFSKVRVFLILMMERMSCGDVPGTCHQ